ncbi:MAG: hypothetical protein GC185_11040 [Alphaproteobacteria bacterium]|nr:hypothetical protein [Alphaproteobacteria bacterium]
MAHCPYDLLEDLKAELETIRGLEGLREPKPGIFYMKSDGFLHFHIKGDARWADVKQDGAWLRLDIPLRAKAKQRADFLRAVIRHHAAYGTKKRTG